MSLTEYGSLKVTSIELRDWLLYDMVASWVNQSVTSDAMNALRDLRE